MGAGDPQDRAAQAGVQCHDQLPQFSRLRNLGGDVEYEQSDWDSHKPSADCCSRWNQDHECIQRQVDELQTHNHPSGHWPPRRRIVKQSP